MYVTIDTNIIIDRQLEIHDFKKGFITPSILKEIKNEEIKQYLDIYMFKIELKNPEEEYILKVKNLQKEKNLNLSTADIEIVALTLELKDFYRKEIFDNWISKDNLKEVKCLTKDNGILQCLKLFNQQNEIESRNFMFRCRTCFQLFNNKLDFCKKCGYNSISRVSVRKEFDKIRVFLKKNYKIKNKVLKDKYGNILRYADQKQYLNHVRDKEKEFKNL